MQQRRQQQVVQTDPEADGDETASASASAASEGGEGLNFRRSLGLGAVWHLAFLSLYQLYIVIALSLDTLQSLEVRRTLFNL